MRIQVVATLLLLAVLCSAAYAQVQPNIVTFDATPSTIVSGSSSTLSWTSVGLTSVSISGVSGSLPTSGTVTVNPTTTTTYTITGTAAGGRSPTPKTVTVTVTPPPTINSFTATPPSILSGNSSTLEWNVSNAFDVSINQGVGRGLLPVGSATVSPGATTTYTLIATNISGDSVSATVTVTVLPPFSISSFTATPPSISNGGSSTLNWVVNGAARVDIDNGVGTSFPASGSVTVSPGSTTTYTLTAFDISGRSITGTVTVTVIPLPTVNSFTATPPAINAGGNSTLNWNVSNASDISINQGVGRGLAAIGSTSVSPGSTTTYTLVATNSLGDSVSATVTVTVTQNPFSIVSFTATPPSISSGSSSTLSWQVVGATNVSIDNSVGSGLSLTGSRSVSPGSTTTYTLTATDAGGSSITATATVTVIPLPTIVSFTATPNPITVGGSSTVSWNVTNAADVSINQGIGRGLAASGSSSVTPGSTTTYQLIATNSLGDSVSAEVTVTVVPLPTINNFSAAPNPVTTGNSSTLSWNVSDSVDVSINNGVGSGLGAVNTASVTPGTTTTYTLTATNAAGDSVTATTTVTVVPLPTINSFTATPSTITEGSSSTLEWDVSGSTDVSINQGIGRGVGATGSSTVTPAVTTTYTLVATNAAGDTVSQDVTVTVVPLPTINSFTATPTTISVGSSSTLDWNVSDSTGVSIDNSVGSGLGGTGSASVTPASTTTYTLTATNAAEDSVTATVTVTVVPLPTINSFTATPSTITVGDSSTLDWDVSDSTDVSIDNSVGSGLSATGSSSVTPGSTTTYTLTATNVVGDSVTATATVTVVPLPTINSFTATPSTITVGDSSTLDWDVSDSTDVSIDNGVGSGLGAVSSASVTPASTTTYTLTATNAAGDSVTATTTVTVVPLPTINSFTATPSTITVGDSSTLDWNVSDSTDVSIDNSVGSGLSATGSSSVTPGSTTTYTLTATNVVGDSVTATVTVTVVPLPTINSFTASPLTITVGSNSTLDWDVSDSIDVSIDNGVGSGLGATGSDTVTPGSTTTYTLTATNAAGDSVTATATVTVVPLPTINSFSATPSTITNGDSSTLDWNVSDSTDVSIDNGVGSGLSETGSASVSPGAPTTYTLTATNAAGDSVTETVEVIVKYLISGTVTDGTFPLQGVEVTLSGDESDTITTGSDGTFSFLVSHLSDVTVTPDSPIYTFDPLSRTLSDVAANQSNQDFEGIRHVGSVLVNLSGADGSGGWRLAGQTGYRSSGNTAGGIPTGNVFVEFQPVSGYNHPDPIQLTVLQDQTTEITAVYSEKEGPTGSVQIDSEGDSIDGSGWRPAGNGSGASPSIADGEWYPFGQVVTGIPVGDHNIEFRTVEGHLLPANEQIRVRPNVTTDVTVQYHTPFYAHNQDYDGDGLDDLATYEAGKRSWSVATFRRSGNSPSARTILDKVFGTKTSVPAPGDYDGDGVTDLSYYDGSTQTWRVLKQFTLRNFGKNGDIPIPGDYLAQGKTQIALYRPSTGEWFIYNHDADSVITLQFGSDSEIPVPGNWDGDADGRTDPAVYNVETGKWRVMVYNDKKDRWVPQRKLVATLGIPGDIPIQSDYDGDGDTDVAVYRPSTNTWIVLDQFELEFGIAGDLPVPSDWAGLGRTIPAVFRVKNGKWIAVDNLMNTNHGQGGQPLVSGR